MAELLFLELRWFPLQKKPHPCCRAMSCQSLPGIFTAQLGLESTFQQILLSGYEVPEERRKWGWDPAEPRARAWHMSSLLALGKRKAVCFPAFVCVSAQAEIQTSPNSSINLLRTKWASLSKRIPPVKDLRGAPELIAGFSTAFPTWVYLGLWNPM